MWLGGLLIGIMSVITFAWARPWGVFGSALLSKQFAIRTAPPLELFKGVVGGHLWGLELQ